VAPFNVHTHQTFYETLPTRTLPWLFLSLVFTIALFIPIVGSILAIKLAVYLLLLLSVLCLVKAAVIKQAVVTLQDDGMVLRGLRPGIWKIFKLWVSEYIPDEKILSIEIGYLRRKTFFGLVSYPPGELSGGAMFQMFLWANYDKHGRKKELYYPHFKNVANFMELIKCLESRYGSKVEKHL